MSNTLFRDFLTPDGSVVINGKPLTFHQSESATYDEVADAIADLPDHIVKNLVPGKDSSDIIIRRQNVIASRDTLVLIFSGSTPHHLKKIHFIPLFDDVDCNDDGELTDDGFVRNLEEIKESLSNNLKQSENNEFLYEYHSEDKDPDNFSYIIKYGSYKYLLEVKSNKEKKSTNVQLHAMN